MRRIRRFLIAATVAAGCGGGGGATIEVTGGGTTVTVHEDPAQIVVRAGDWTWSTTEGAATDAGGPPLGFAGIGTGGPEVEMMYGAYKFDDLAPAWTGVDRLGALTAAPGDPGAATFELRAGGDLVGTGRVAVDAAGHVAITLEATGPTAHRVSLAAECVPGEHMVGLGGQSFDIDHRGETVPLFVQEDGIGKLDLRDDDYTGLWFLNGRRHSTHTPMPMLLSSGSYALLAETTARATFALCSEDPEVARYEVAAPRLDLRLFVGTGADPMAPLAAMLDHVGRPPPPPAFTFGLWVDAIFGEANVARVAQRLRDEGVAASAIWTEDWRGGEDTSTGYALDEDWRVDRELYPNLETLIDDVHGLGFKFLTYYNTFVDESADVYAEAIAAEHVVQAPGGGPYLFTGIQFHPSALLDLTNAEAVDWATAIMQEGIDQGADGWMADFGEWLPVDGVLADGTDALAVGHNTYPNAWARLNTELFAAQADGVDRLAFVRSAWLGAQPDVQVLWTGDQQTDFSDGDGLPSVIPMMINLGLAGFPYTGSDVAGYMSQFTAPTTEELWYRWVTLGALSPVMRTHHGRDARLNFQWETDAASIAHLVRWSRLHMQLVPYLRGLAADAALTGKPLVRLTALEFPIDDWAWTVTDQYLLGDRVLVAPVVRAGATARDVQLPRGAWYPLAGGAPYDGPGTVSIPAPVTEIPVLMREGSILVVYPPEVDTVVDAPGAPGVVTAASIGPDREAWIWRGPGSPAGTWTDRIEPAAGRTWTWTGRDPALPLPTAATWNGIPITVTVTPVVESVVELYGDGTLAFDGGGELVIAGSGGAAAHTIVRLR